MIKAQYALRDQIYPVRIIETYPTPEGTRAVIETLDGQAPFFTQGSRISKYTPWTTTNLENLQDVHCNHEHTVLDVTGGMHYSPDIGAWDDIHETVFCLDCGQEVEPKVDDESPWEDDTDEIPF